MTTSSTNPWQNFRYNSANNQNYLREEDDGFIQQYNEFIKKYRPGSADYTNAELHLELFPEPFEGNPDAPIYLLGANPGYGDYDIWWCRLNDECLRSVTVNGKTKECDSVKYSTCSQQRPNYLRLMPKNLTHQVPFVFFNEDISIKELTNKSSIL